MKISSRNPRLYAVASPSYYEDVDPASTSGTGISSQPSSRPSTEIASQSAELVTTNRAGSDSSHGAPSVVPWLPWIGVGLGAYLLYDNLRDKSDVDSQSLHERALLTMNSDVLAASAGVQEAMRKGSKDLVPVIIKQGQFPVNPFLLTRLKQAESQLSDAQTEANQLLASVSAAAALTDAVIVGLASKYDLPSRLVDLMFSNVSDYKQRAFSAVDRFMATISDIYRSSDSYKEQCTSGVLVPQISESVTTSSTKLVTSWNDKVLFGIFGSQKGTRTANTIKTLNNVSKTMIFRCTQKSLDVSFAVLAMSNKARAAQIALNTLAGWIGQLPDPVAMVEAYQRSGR